MGKFFVDPYKKYYEKLSGATNIVSESDAISSSITSANEALSSLSSSLSSSGWNELGIQEIATSTIPSLVSNVNTFKTNIDSVLKAATTQAINSLLPETEQLKKEDENYERVTNKLNNLYVPTQYDNEGNETSLYRVYITEKANLEEEKNNSEKKCIDFQKSCDAIANAIKALDGSITDLKATIISGDSTSTKIEVIDGVGNGTMYRINFAGKEFYVANTKTNLFEYEQYLLKNNIRQNAGFKDNQCDSLSKQIAVDLMRGTMTKKSLFASSSTGPALRIKKICKSQNEEDILKFVYEEVSNGRPVALQVTQKRSNEGLRHFVTVVGFASSVQNYSDLTPDNILVLDCVDGMVQTLSGYERTDGKAHNRKLFNQGGDGYYALGATDEFLAKEVYTNKYNKG